MKSTPFYEIHKALGGKMIEFGGYEMPVQYPSGIVQEHLAVRRAVGVFDVSHMGEFEVTGRDAFAFLQRMTVNDVSKLFEGRVQYSAMCYDDGGIVDDLLVYHCGGHYMLVVNASNITKDFDWLKSHINSDVKLIDVSDRTALLAVQGPASMKTLQKLTKTDLVQLKYYHSTRGEIAGVPALISRTGYTGELGFEIYFEADPALGKKIWDAIFDAGEEYGIAPVGLGARDTLRLEMGFCLYGSDIDQTTHPLEAGLEWITKLEKGDFVGKSALVDAKKKGLKRRLAGFTVSDKNIPRHGYPLKTNGSQIGVVTSGTFSPSLRQGIGLGYVTEGLAITGTTISLDIRGKEVAANVVNLPFHQKSKGSGA